MSIRTTTRRCTGVTCQDRKCKLRISKDKGYFCHIHNPIDKNIPFYFIFHILGESVYSEQNSLIKSVNPKFLVNFLVYLYVIFVFFKFFGG